MMWHSAVVAFQSELDGEVWAPVILHVLLLLHLPYPDILVHPHG